MLDTATLHINKTTISPEWDTTLINIMECSSHWTNNICFVLIHIFVI